MLSLLYCCACWQDSQPPVRAIKQLILHCMH